MTLKGITLLATTALAGMVVAGAANAVTITGSSSGSFANLSSCDNSGGNQDCRIVNTGNGNNTQVQWGSTSQYTNFVNPSTLTANSIAISGATDTSLVIGQLTWFNSATLGSETDDLFYVNYTLSVTFTSPNNSSDSELFNLTISNPTNPPGDTVAGLTLADLSNLSFNLNGVTVSNIHYEVADGAGSCQGTDTSFSNGTWYNCEGNTAYLYIVADFTATTPPVGVPEPATLALFGAGLAGLGMLGRRRRAA